MPVTLESRLRQMQVFNLDHPFYCAAGRCTCGDIEVLVVEENPRTGEQVPRRVSKKAPAALTLLARERREGLRDSVLSVPAVRAAVERGHVRVVEQTPAPVRARSSRARREG